MNIANTHRVFTRAVGAYAAVQVAFTIIGLKTNDVVICPCFWSGAWGIALGIVEMDAYCDHG